MSAAIPFIFFLTDSTNQWHGHFSKWIGFLSFRDWPKSLHGGLNSEEKHAYFCG
jgi:hypothetical protein